ncbi:hypothetical protein SEA_TARDUS_3 [Gordonia phage Tardus]|uniref:Uncharacterized protein n=1 Tax=Gordonia phage Tardus TaxID=2939734 RepID=A0A9E7E6P6_9CAUD|nr:hypothetical protein SEA_TARDUS_3 [Gordonia phage Tardus]
MTVATPCGYSCGMTTTSDTAVTAAAGRIVGRVGHEHIVTNGVGTALGAKLIARELRRNPGMSDPDLCAAVIARAEQMAAR